jgi:hypothetical protein
MHNHFHGRNLKIHLPNKTVDQVINQCRCNGELITTFPQFFKSSDHEVKDVSIHSCTICLIKKPAAVCEVIQLANPKILSCMNHM